MLVSHRKKFIFTKTVKTAGTSIESYYEKYCMPEGEWQESHKREEYVSETGIIGYRGRCTKGCTWFNHMAAKKIKNQIGDEIWNSYFKFTVIRNPYDKLISGYYFLREHDKRNGKLSRIFILLIRKISLENVLNKLRRKDEVEMFRKWIADGGGLHDKNKYLMDGEVCVDFFIRYENMHQDMNEICERLDIPFNPCEIPQFKKGVRKYNIPVKDYYDEVTIAKVKEQYPWEIERFNYTVPE